MATVRREGEKNLSDLYKIYVREGGILSYLKYKEVMEMFMKEIIKKIVSTGFEFSMPYYCGLLRVQQIERKFSIKEDGTVKGAIDWGNSNKLKADIIERGELPLVVYKDDKGEKIGDNGGTAWLCYFTTSTYFCWTWVSHINMKNCLKYKFDITWSNSKILSSSINEDSNLLFKMINKDNGTNKDYINRIFTTASTK